LTRAKVPFRGYRCKIELICSIITPTLKGVDLQLGKIKFSILTRAKVPFRGFRGKDI